MLAHHFKMSFKTMAIPAKNTSERMGPSRCCQVSWVRSSAFPMPSALPPAGSTLHSGWAGLNCAMDVVHVACDF